MTRRCSEKSPSGHFESLSRWDLVLFLVYPLLLPVGELEDALQFYSFNQSPEKVWTSHIELSFIVLLTALEMAHGGTPGWRAGSANRLECTKKRISLQNTRLPLHLRVLATNALSSLCP